MLHAETRTGNKRNQWIDWQFYKYGTLNASSVILLRRMHVHDYIFWKSDTYSSSLQKSNTYNKC